MTEPQFKLEEQFIEKQSFRDYIKYKQFSLLDFALMIFIITVITAIPGILIAVFT